jgi:hypothetical protein
MPGVIEAQTFGERIHVRLSAEGGPEREQVLAVLARAGLTAGSVRPIPASLEDVFISRVTAPAPRETRQQGRRA